MDRIRLFRFWIPFNIYISTLSDIYTLIPSESSYNTSTGKNGDKIRCDVFKNNTYYLDRVYLHSMLHCMFSHLWIAGQRDRQLWGIACDIVVEYVIDHMDKPSTKRALSWIRQQMYGEIELQN